uniref:AMP-binding domain-containing protein n=1 Tax=Parastrongyloides trichosuri TaxID=131310 RepID=A0A0N4ZUT6_PARTI
MSLKIKEEEVYCLDFTRHDEKFDPLEKTIPELIHSRDAWDEKYAVICDSEKVSLTFARISQLMDQLAAGLLVAGIPQGSKILICSYNNYDAFIAALACTRADITFCLYSPKMASPEDFHELLVGGGFKGVILFKSGKDSDEMGSMILDLYPEMKMFPRGNLKIEKAPYLTHVILADEDHRHAGTFTLSDIYSKGTKEMVGKLPEYRKWNCHKLAAIQYTLGHSGKPKLVGLSHYQLVNGAYSASFAIGINKNTKLCVALPMYRIPVFCLMIFTPFIHSSITIISEPSPIPRFIFQSISKHFINCILTNGIALRLLLRISMTQKVTMPSVKTCILVGEKVHKDLLTDLVKQMPNAKQIACGYCLTETGSIPLLTDNTSNLITSVGKCLPGYEIDVRPINGLNSSKEIVGELFIRPFNSTKFFGYAPTFNTCADWVSSGDIVSVKPDSNIELISNKEDLIYDREGLLVPHWKIEKCLSKFHQIKGIQVISICPGAPVIAVVIPRNVITQDKIEYFKNDMITMLRNEKIRVPERFAIVFDFPRTHARIKKKDIRNVIMDKKAIFI